MSAAVPAEPALLRSRALAPGLLWRAASASTNTDLVGRAEGMPDLAVVVTDTQTAGRGRLDRAWTAPGGSALAVSVLVRTDPGTSPRMLGWLPLLAGAAMAAAVGRLGVTGAGVKWPNDVLVDGRKLSGVLTELTPHGVVIGAGLNTGMTREQLPVPTATSLRLEGAVDDDEDAAALLDRALATYLEELFARIAVWREASAPEELRMHVEPLLLTMGRAVRVDRSALAPLYGTARGLDGDGRLLVQPERGETLAVSAGDVTHLRHE